jgi:hypothetical protein
MNRPDSQTESPPHSGHFLAVSRILCEILGLGGWGLRLRIDRLDVAPVRIWTFCLW